MRMRSMFHVVWAEFVNGLYAMQCEGDVEVGEEGREGRAEMTTRSLSALGT